MYQYIRCYTFHLSVIASSGAGELERALVKGFSNMTRENNAMTGESKSDEVRSHYALFSSGSELVHQRL